MNALVVEEFVTNITRPTARLLPSSPVGRLMVSVLAAIVIVVVAPLAITTVSAQAYCKAVNGNNHCYALVNSNQTYEGTWVDMLDSAASVYESYGRMQNETWAGFSGGGWVEDGTTLGYIGGHGGPIYHTTTPVWFYGGEYPYGSSLYEADYTSGPAVGSWYYMQEQDEGNGTWCAWLQGGESSCVGGRPLYTSNEQAGLEASATVEPYNYGTAYAWGMNLGSGSWSGWAGAHNEYSETPGGAKYCTYSVAWNPNSGLGDPGGSGDYAAGVAYGTPNSNPSCESNKDAALAEPPTPFSGSLTAEPAEGPVPRSYTAPTGPTLSDTALSTIANAVATEDGDSTVAPSTMETVQTTLEKALSATEPNTVIPATRTDAYNRLLNSTTNLVVLHGQFTATNTPRPPGQPAMSGTVLELIIDAHTGWVDGFRLGDSQRADLSSLWPSYRASVGPREGMWAPFIAVDRCPHARIRSIEYERSSCRDATYGLDSRHPRRCSARGGSCCELLRSESS